MDHSQILMQTAKGKEEIRTKAFNLSPRLRRLLVLVDGESTVAATLSRLAVLGEDLEPALDALLADGYVAPRPSAPPLDTLRCDDARVHRERGPAPLPATPAKATAPPTPLRFNLEKAKGFARFIVLGYLGPVGARRVERIDAAGSAAELRAELRDLRDILPKLLRKRQAKELWDQLEPLMLSAGTQAPVWHQGPRQRRQETVRTGRPSKTPVSPDVWDKKDGIDSDPSQSELAARILEFAEPLTDAANGDAANGADATKRALQVAIICWNAAILPGNKGLETIAPTLREVASGDRRLERELFDIYEIMRARKLARFQADNRFIVDFSLIDTPSGLRLQVSSAPLSPERVGPAISSA
jgi:hypothetical protein